jgi:hypothetical protein
MATGHSWGGATRANSNHPALARASAPLLIQGGEFFHALMSLCLTVISFGLIERSKK